MKYLLDTNIVGLAVKLNPNLMNKLATVDTADLFISAVTLAEIHYGLSKKPNANNLHRTVQEFLLRVSVLNWTNETALIYGKFRAEIEQQGLSLSALDMMIAAHAKAENAVLVSNDNAFFKISDLSVEDWTK
ncbi:MAG: type II toxin-antitoxin system VapC family toxin [Neisseriaceae bacterium]|nr:type II toxin-antitoxin system VapC family toxin [Neisseriaceae bacterium]MBQ5429726.1 type II toxin-antitoxin system VapC family toxin [Neisseriaceae bacterium]